ncbi:MAG: hydroxyacid dehydrogenase [Candidatus Eisenbacteria bacterium]|nr:hydroxyacid dehydrogenase [Candidatus Eisenbacteria bacterium]
MKILVTDSLDHAALSRLRAAGHEVVELPGLQGEALIGALVECRALVIRGGTRVTSEVLRGSPSLRVVVRAGSGLDNVDQAAARRQGVAVFNTPAANAVSVAELVFGLLLALERRIAGAFASLRGGAWEKFHFMGRELSGRRLSLIGFGRIGREVALRARAFEMRVSACDPLVAAWPAGFTWVERVTLEGALERADVLSLHVPLGPETRGLIGPSEFASMPQGAVLVNVARGGLVDEPALLDALIRGHLSGAALDVFSTEPPGSHPLFDLPNVVATPHLGASTLEAQRRAGEEAATAVIEALAALES